MKLCGVSCMNVHAHMCVPVRQCVHICVCVCVCVCVNAPEWECVLCVHVCVHVGAHEQYCASQGIKGGGLLS